MMCHYPADGSAALTLKYNNIPWQILQGLFGKLTKFFVVFCVKLRAQHAAQPGRDIANGTYSVTLQEQYSYSVGLEGADGYIVGSNNNVTLANEAGNTKFDIDIIPVSLLDITGSLADLTKEAAADRKSVV